MIKTIVMVFAFMQGCRAGLDEKTFIKNENLTNYMPTSGYILESTSRSVPDCGATCLKTTNCSSFFYDTNSQMCQLHSTVPDNTTAMASSLTAKCYVDQAYKYPANSVPSSVCPNGTFSYNNGQICYFFDETTLRNFTAAKEYCNMTGGEIVKIDDAAQELFIEQMLQQNSTDGMFYIGLNDEEVQDDYRWSDGATSIPIHTNWGDSQPAGGAEHCVVLFRPDSWRWHNTYCSDLGPVICQM